MSNLVEIDLLILDSSGIAIKNINVRTKYTNGTSFKDEKTNTFGHRIVTASSNKNIEIYVEDPNGKMEFNKTLNSTLASTQVQPIKIKRPISAYSKKAKGNLRNLKIKLIDSDGSVLINFPIRTGYKDSSRFSNRTTDDKGFLEFQASSDKIIEIKSIDLSDNFISIGYFSSNETRLISVKHKFKINQFLSKTTAKIVDIDGSHIYPNAKIKITYNGNSGIKTITNGLLNVATYIGYPIEFTVYKPDNTPLQTKMYVASQMKPSSGFEIRVPVNLTSGTTNTDRPSSTQTASPGVNAFLTSCIPLYTGEKITEDDYTAAASQLSCEVAAIKAVAQIESSSRGAFQVYLGKKVPTILYERHYFKKATGGRYDRSHDKLSGPYNPAYYGKYNAQYPKLLEAMGLDEDAGLKSCSWGKFQIMGANHKNCGYLNVKEMIKDTFKNEKEHLKHFVNFVMYDRNLLTAIQNKRWANFAKGYNGASYADNKYDVKMKKAYDFFVINPRNLP